jgi:hypothetical protein
MWSRLGRCALLAIVLAASLAWMPQARAQQSAPFPSSPLPTNAELSYLVEGEIDSEIDDKAHLIFERFDLKSGESLPTESGPQILISLSGTLKTIDDLGLAATLGPSERLFAPAGSIAELTAVDNVSVLRARIANGTAEEPKLTIAEDGCVPGIVSVPAGSTLQIVNATLRRQRFSLMAQGLELDIAPNSTSSLDLSSVPTGDWVADCGLIRRSDDPITKVTVRITPTETSDTGTATDPGHSILFETQIEGGASSASTLYVAKLTLPGKATTGEQIFDGITGIVATAQPLKLLRKNKLPASLPANTSVLIPAGTTATIENASTKPAEVFVLGLLEVATTASDSENDDDERPTARDSDEAPSSTPTPVATARAADNEPDSYLVFIPTTASVSDLGFTLIGSEERPVYADSLVGAFMPNKTAAGWVTGQLFAYSDNNSSINVAITVDEFISVDAASTMMEEMTSQTLRWGTFATPPRPGNASNIAANVLDLTESRQTGTQVTGQFGRFLVTVLVLTPIYTNGMPIARDFWDLVSATQD